MQIIVNRFFGKIEKSCWKIPNALNQKETKFHSNCHIVRPEGVDQKLSFNFHIRYL